MLGFNLLYLQHHNASDAEGAGGEPGRLARRGAIAALFLAAYVAAAYAGFAWLESIRGRQVYPPGSLQSIVIGGGVVAVLAATAALALAVRAGVSLRGLLAPSPLAAPAAPRTGIFRAVPVLALLAVAIAFTNYAVRHSVTHGRLAFPPFFDDVGYLEDGMHRLFVYADGGLGALVADYYRAAPHAPTSSFLAFLGFRLFGLQDWAPALMNFVIVFGLLLLVRYFSHQLPLWLRIPVYLFALAWPFPFLAVVHCIPDFLCATGMATGAYFIAVTPWASRHRRVHLFAGACFGLALLAKPAMSPVTFFLFGGSLLAATAWQFSVTGATGLLRAAGLPALRALLTALAICVPHYLVNWRSIDNYIRVNTFGSHRDVWKFDGTPSEQLLYYVTGPGGIYGMGPLLAIWPLVALLAAWAAWRARSTDAIRAAAGALTALALTHAVVSVTTYKSVFLGMTISAFLLLSGAAMLAYALGEFYGKPGPLPRAGLALCLGVTALAAAQFRPQPMRTILAHIFRDYPRQGADFAREGEYRRDYLARILQTLRADPRPNIRVGFIRTNLFFMPAVFQFQARKDRTRHFEFVDAGSYGADDNAFLTEAAGTDYLLTFSPATPAAEEKLLALLQTRDRWKIAARWPAPLDGGQILLLAHAATWRSVDFFSPSLPGFSAIEGPYPPATYRIRWALAPGITLPVAADVDESVELHMSASTPFANQAMDILLDGKRVANEPVAAGSAFRDIRVPLRLPAGPHTLEIRFAVAPKTADPRPIAVLFREFRIVAAP